MVLRTAAPKPPGNVLEMQSLGSHPDLLNWKLEAWGPAVCVLTRPPGGSGAHSSVRTTAIQDTETSLLNDREFAWNLRKPCNDAQGRVTKALHRGSARLLLFPQVEKPQKWMESSQNEKTRWAEERSTQVSYLRPKTAMTLDDSGAGSTVTLALSAPCGFLSRAGRRVQPGGSATAGALQPLSPGLMACIL